MYYYYLMLCYSLEKTLLFHFGVDPAQFYTTPNYSRYAMLKNTQVLLELITDLEMYDMIKSNIRGGSCTTGSIRDMHKQIIHI